MSQTIEKPMNYICCTATEGSCPLRETCLRSKVHREATYSGTNYYGLTVINIWNADINPLTANCKAYRKAVPKMFAQGFDHLFDSIPKGIYPTVLEQVTHVFTNRLFYFNCKKGRRLTSPEEQKKIAQIFKRNGIETAPVYDKMVEVYDYSE